MTIAKIADKIRTLIAKGMQLFQYCYKGVWRDTRQTPMVSVIKTLSLFIRSFLDSDLQTKACALTYRTLLSVVPALAMIFAIGRGFGLQDVIVKQLFRLFPSQRVALEEAFNFVDSYLNQASEGVFVGVGIVFLLWTLISLLSNVEANFNQIWHVDNDRSMMRKVTDYLAIFIVLPILMICGGGISILMSTTLKTLLPFDFMGPAITFMLDLAGWVFTWLFFTGAYMLIPNARVKFINALIPGVLVGSAFQILQWLFLSGQMYVAKYNAIYGSVSFLPLLLIWFQLVWLFTLVGALLCYASQNVGRFNFSDDISAISHSYRRKAEIAIMAIVAKRFWDEEEPLNCEQLSQKYGLPLQLVLEVTRDLRSVGLLSYIEPTTEGNAYTLQPAVDISRLTVGEVVRRLQAKGASDFIPSFNEHYKSVVALGDSMTAALIDKGEKLPIISLEISG